MLTKFIEHQMSIYFAMFGNLDVGNVNKPTRLSARKSCEAQVIETVTNIDLQSVPICSCTINVVVNGANYCDRNSNES